MKQLTIRNMAGATTLVAASLAAIASGAIASPIYLCIPTVAGKTVKSGGTTGSCGAGDDPVALPAEPAEQEKLLSILPYEKYEASGVGGKPTIRFSGANVQIVSGGGTTEEENGKGNLVIGYDEHESSDTQTGSNNLVIGTYQTFTSYGGLLAGKDNQILEPYASVSGGAENISSRELASVSGGLRNTASGYFSSVSGGVGNTASGYGSSVSGGSANTASEFYSSVSGGEENTASSADSSVSGGGDNTASSGNSSISGGYDNTASSGNSSISGGYENRAKGRYSSILGSKNILVEAEFGVSP